MGSRDWIDLARDAETGIETLRAHFEGHAYDPHWHDSYLIGYTEIGVQQFNCRRRRHDSTAGQVFLVEPGRSTTVARRSPAASPTRCCTCSRTGCGAELRATFDDAPSDRDPGFHANLTEDPRLTLAIAQAFRVLHGRELRLLRQTALELVLERLRVHLGWREAKPFDPRLPLVAQKARDYLHAHFYEDIGLDELASACGTDRFRLNRAFKAAYGLPPYAYLVQLRLAKARQMLAVGGQPADLASALGFADQSHLGRWFRRAYGMTPAAYRRQCTQLPD
ncbi:AraC family transcriptional regulator [Pseudomonas aeruginosa]|nr:AraC family transcriptional regulator [Pseudomonas aeruginosa]